MRHLPLALFLLLAVAPAGAADRSSAEADVAFTYGVRAFQHGELDEAVRLLREAVAADPGDGTARYWLGLALLRRGEAGAAADEIAASLEAERPPAVDRARVEDDLRRARSAAPGTAVAAPGFAGLLALRDQPRFDLRLGGFFGQDSNPSLLPEDAVAVGARIGTLRGEVEDDVADLDLRAAVYPFYDRRGWSLGLAAGAKAARFQELDVLDRRQWNAALQLAWGADPLGFLTGPLGYTRVPFGHGRLALLFQAGVSDLRQDGDPLARSDQAALTLVLREAPATATQVELAVERRDLLDGAAEADAWSAGVFQSIYLGRRDRSLRLGVARSQESDGLDGDVTGLEGSTELALPLGSRLTLQIAAARRRDEIDGDVAGVSFDDTTTRAAAALSWNVIRHLYLVGRASWAERDSTLVPADPDPLSFRDYQRTTLALGFQWIR